MFMPNAHKGEAEIGLADGRTLSLVFNANAWIAVEEQLGKPTPDIVEELQSGRASLKTQRALMWGGLRKHHPEIGIEEAGDLLIDAAEAMSKALTGGMPHGEGPPAEGEEGPPVIAAPGTGTGSAIRGPASGSTRKRSTTSR